MRYSFIDDRASIYERDFLADTLEADAHSVIGHLDISARRAGDGFSRTPWCQWSLTTIFRHYLSKYISRLSLPPEADVRLTAVYDYHKLMPRHARRHHFDKYSTTHFLMHHHALLLYLRSSISLLVPRVVFASSKSPRRSFSQAMPAIYAYNAATPAVYLISVLTISFRHHELHQKATTSFQVALAHTSGTILLPLASSFLSAKWPAWLIYVPFLPDTSYILARRDEMPDWRMLRFRLRYFISSLMFLLDWVITTYAAIIDSFALHYISFILMIDSTYFR